MDPRIRGVALLFALEALARALLATVIPLQTLALVGDARRLSVLYFVVGVLGLAGSLFIPLLASRLPRRRLYALAAAVLASGGGLLLTRTVVGQVLGMVARLLGAAGLGICLNLYVLEALRREDLQRYEALKFLFAASSLTAGPLLGVLLATRIGLWCPVLASAGCALAMAVALGRIAPPQRRHELLPSTAGPQPLRQIGRFLDRPRLRHAWLLGFGRVAWWGMYFVYGPVLAIEAGLGATVAGLLASAGNAMLFVSPFWAWLARRAGVRAVIGIAFLAAAIPTLAASLAGGAPRLALGLLALASFAAAGLDAVGNLPFLHAIGPHQRPEMATLYATHRDIGELGPPGAFALVLSVTGLGGVFATGGILALSMALSSRHLPRDLETTPPDDGSRSHDREPPPAGRPR